MRCNLVLVHEGHRDPENYQSLQWSAGGLHHAIVVEPQGTTSAAMRRYDLPIKVLAHLLLDVLPTDALRETVDSMAEIFQYHLLPQTAEPQLEPERYQKRASVSRTTVRPEVDLLEE